ncbi:MAG TPA: transcriptional repressor [Ktedonobacterales bacterium]|nr:transcriptional repressor [Ktedonobacterales bacterium]
MRPSSLTFEHRPDTAHQPDNETLVLEALRETDRHPTANDLYETVRHRQPRIGRATVYRALQRLVAAGQAIEVARDSFGRRYDARTERHDHCVCAGCGRVIDLILPAAIPDIAFARLAEVAARAGFAMDAYELRLRGLCAECQSERPVESYQPDPSDDSRLDSPSLARSPASQSPRR